MLSGLHIRNYVLVDSLDIGFPEGLVVISGPTGAGKSVIVGSVGLLSGSKADASVIAEGADNCVVEGEFTSSDRELAVLCEENDIETDGDNYILRRVISRSGRSRAFVNDCPVSLSVLSSVGRRLVDIHSQHDTMLLSDSSYQLSVLDKFAGNDKLLKECAELCSELSATERNIAELKERIRRAEQELEYNTSLFEQLDKAAVRDGELAELEEEQNRLANSEQIKELLCSSLALFESSEERAGVNSSLMSICRNFDKLSSFIPAFAGFSRRLEEARIEIKDLSDELEAANEKMDCSPERLQWLDDRIALIYSLLKRHGCSNEAELVGKRDALAKLVGGCEEMQDELDELSSARDALVKRYDTCAAALHEAREKASSSFSAQVSSSLAYMELEGSVFTVTLSPVPAGPRGRDELVFLFAGRGARPAPVAKCASGGEMSRIMLALKDVMSSFMHIPTIIFDEIDTGVSGSVADRMGSVILRLGERMQVFAITHLPQVAAKGRSHYLVEKTAVSGKAVSSMKKLSDDQRVLEVARMLSGSDITNEALANAKSLLQ